MTLNCECVYQSLHFRSCVPCICVWAPLLWMIASFVHMSLLLSNHSLLWPFVSLSLPTEIYKKKYIVKAAHTAHTLITANSFQNWNTFLRRENQSRFFFLFFFYFIFIRLTLLIFNHVLLALLGSIRSSIFIKNNYIFMRHNVLQKNK